MKLLVALIAMMAMVAVVVLPAPTAVEGAEGWTGTVIGSGVNVRTAPSTDSELVMSLDPGEKIDIVEEVEGEAVVGNYSSWYRTVSGYYVYARYIAKSNPGPLANSGNPQSGQTGRWLDADLSRQILTAMEGDQPVYGAEITIGRVGWETPPGNYTILRKVENETMDSATIGIPRNSVEGYYLTDVLYTQYYTEGGHALHYNYWVDPDAFGTQHTSRGCMGLRLADAEFFYNFTEVGTPLIIHH